MSPLFWFQVTTSPINTFDLVFTKRAFRSGLQAKGWPSANQTNAAGQVAVTATPKAKTLLLGFDVSCQQGTFDMQVADGTMPGSNSRPDAANGTDVLFDALGSEVSVEVDFSALAPAAVPWLKRVQANTVSGKWGLGWAGVGWGWKKGRMRCFPALWD
jgi:hypothetical protein